MRKVDVSYIAGIVDGEAWLKLSTQKSNAGNLIYRPVVTVSMTDIEVIDWLAEFFGMGSLQTINPQQEHYLVQRRWTVVSRQAYQVCKILIPYLRVKKLEAQKIIDHYEHPCKKKIRRPGQQGRGNPRSKLTELDAQRILDYEGNLSQRELASKYGVSQSLVYSIRKRKSWKHLVKTLV